MIRYHGTLGNRAFMKLLNLDNAGHDLDEVIASPKAEWKRPWWVNSVKNPTVEIDWDRVQRFDGTKIQQISFNKYVGDEKAAQIRKLKVERTSKWILENRPGFMLRDLALDIAGRQGAIETTFLGHCNDTGNKSGGYNKRIRGPKDLGVPRYEGNPEENSRMIRAALKNFGAAQAGFLELDDKNIKFIYSVDTDGKKLEFEDIEEAYETKEKKAIPIKAGWVIIFTVQMSEELYKRHSGRMPTSLSASTTGLAYTRGENITDRLQTFLHVLGYKGYMTYWINGLGIAPALAVMSGIGELSRLNKVISPEYGPMQRIFRVITDLPLAPTGPIDAGIMRFCRTCKKCAESCPVKALSMDTDPSWEIKGEWNSPGHRAYFEDGVKCTAYWLGLPASCSTCMAVCPYTKKDRSFIHHVVEATIAKTPAFNNLFTRMDSMMGYDKPKDTESWWNLNLPAYGVDPTTGTIMDK